jgi:hypothetical protein
MSRTAKAIRRRAKIHDMPGIRHRSSVLQSECYALLFCSGYTVFDSAPGAARPIPGHPLAASLSRTGSLGQHRRDYTEATRGYERISIPLPAPRELAHIIR